MKSIHTVLNQEKYSPHPHVKEYPLRNDKPTQKQWKSHTVVVRPRPGDHGGRHHRPQRRRCVSGDDAGPEEPLALATLLSLEEKPTATTHSMPLQDLLVACQVKRGLIPCNMFLKPLSRYLVFIVFYKQPSTTT